METGSRIAAQERKDRFDFTGTAKGGCPDQSRRRASDAAAKPYRRPFEAMTDQHSFGCMEERYGIREEGIF
ncbi:MAG: hypothetical protein AB1558_08575 [Thermodesulfobacteriota bacterium]